MRVLFTQNFADVKFRENKTLTKIYLLTVSQIALLPRDIAVKSKYMYMLKTGL